MIKLSWEDIERMTSEIAEDVKVAPFEPDYIIGITTSGLTPLHFLAKKLGIANILTVSANSYDRDKKGEFKISYLPEVNLEDKKILLVDEIVGTGETLREVTGAMYIKYKPKELKTATLVVLEESNFSPDFYALKTKDEWVVFPWDKNDFPEYFN